MEETAQSWRDRRLLLFAAFGAAVALFGFPPGRLWLLALLAPAPLIAFSVQNPPKAAARAGFAYGFGFFSGLIYWIAYTLTVFGYLHWVISVPILLLFVSYLALYPALFSFGVSRLSENGGPKWALAAAPILWTGLEWARSYLFTGFGWGDIPQALWRERWALDLAPSVGAGGVLFLALCLNVAAAWLFLPGKEKRASAAALAVPAAALTVLGVLYSTEKPASELVRKGVAGIVQGNIPQGSKWEPTQNDAIMKRYRDLTLKLTGEGKADFILWPETAVPGFVQFDNFEKRAVEAAAKAAKTPLIFGAPAVEAVPGGKRQDRNGVFSISETGGILGRYDKVHLVPFGEYVPLAGILPFISKLTQASGDFRPGTAVFPVPFGKEGLKAGPLVCFESIFPELATAQAKAGAEILVVLTNDAWFGNTSAPEQHLAYSAWRAAENGLWLARAANTGISAVFDGQGEMISSTKLDETVSFLAEVEYRRSDGLLQSKLSPLTGPFSLLLAIVIYSVILRPSKKPGKKV
ncbi:apolipoprotein N-acyltransferase [bacterium]|nr:MAG: apolipoprotein N-acyltransferase [bacterium]